MNKDNVQLLLEKLIDLQTDEARNNRFDLNVWSNGVDELKHNPAKPDTECGFAGCVLGWAAHEKWFEAQGLRLFFRARGPLDRSWPAGDIRDPGDLPRLLGAQEEHDDGWGDVDPAFAFARFLDVDESTVNLIIYADYYADKTDVTLQDVIERVQFLHSNGEMAFEHEFEAARDDDDDDN